MKISHKFDYLLEILYKLDRAERVTVNSLINEFEKGERTILRYIQTLQTAKFPVFYSKKKKSYVFEEGYFLRKPDISVEEELALALAKNLLKNFGTGMEKGISAIEKKLSLKDKGMPSHIVIRQEPQPPVVQGILDTLFSASRNFKAIEIVYKAVYSQKETKREVNPYYLFYKDGIWYMRGYCHLRKEVRTFAVDRMASARVINRHFAPVNIDPEAELSGAFGPVVGGEPVRVVLRFDSEIKPFIVRKEWHNSQKVKELKDGGIEVSFNVNGLEDIKTWIYKWLPHVEVVSPKKLKDRMQADLEQALKKCK